MKACTIALLLAASLALLTACSSKQGYASNQAWKRNQCTKVIDAQERIRCLREADASSDRYKKEREELKAPR